MDYNTEVLDDLDLQILTILSEDARQSSRLIAKQIGVSVGTVYNRIKNLNRRGIIRGYIPLLDHVKMGYVFTVLILIQVEGQHLVEVEETLADAKGITAVYDITGEFDVAILAKFTNQSALNTFIKSTLKIPYIKRTVTNMVLNVVKEDPRIKFK